MRAMCATAVAVLAFGLTGCGGGGADGAIKEQIASVNDMADAMKSGDVAKVKKAAERAKAADAKLKDLKVTAEEKKKLEEKYKDELGKAMANLLGAAMTAKFSDADKKEIDEAMKALK